MRTFKLLALTIDCLCNSVKEFNFKQIYTHFKIPLWNPFCPIKFFLEWKCAFVWFLKAELESHFSTKTSLKNDWYFYVLSIKIILRNEHMKPTSTNIKSHSMTLRSPFPKTLSNFIKTIFMFMKFHPHFFLDLCPCYIIHHLNYQKVWHKYKCNFGDAHSTSIVSGFL